MCSCFTSFCIQIVRSWIKSSNLFAKKIQKPTHVTLNQFLSCKSSIFKYQCIHFKSLRTMKVPAHDFYSIGILTFGSCAKVKNTFPLATWCKHLNMLETSQCTREWFPSKEIAKVKYIGNSKRFIHSVEIFVN